ncbi:hypothetical protein ACIGFK_38975 [Streptomyces sp. NPDC085524]|uniref:hypothetical protein n=1 Tax=Streptomyces sp. NPDC085524 TaxID=3365728 RepID=UPI0037D83A0A
MAGQPHQGRCRGGDRRPSPELSAEERSRAALAGIRLFQAMMPLAVAAEGGERAALVRDLERALRGYLADTIG